MRRALIPILFARNTWTPARLFGSSDQGYVLSAKYSTQHQDSAGMTAAAVGAAVGRIADYAGKGHVFTQAVAGSKGFLRQDGAYFFWELDKTDDYWLSSAAVTMSGSDKMTEWAAVRKSSDVSIGMISEISADTGVNVGSGFMVGPLTNGAANYHARSRGSAASVVGLGSTAATYTAPHSGVLIATHDIAGDSTTLEVNGVAATPSSTDKGTGNWGDYVHYVGMRGGVSLPFGDRIYEVGRINRILTDPELKQLRAYCRRMSGIVF